MAAAVELGAGWEATCRSAVRGSLDAVKPEDPLALENLEVVAEYAHTLDTDATLAGSVGIAIQAITVSLSRSTDRHETSNASLHLAATYTRKEPVPALPAPPEAPASG